MSYDLYICLKLMITEFFKKKVLTSKDTNTRLMYHLKFKSPLEKKTLKSTTNSNVHTIISNLSYHL